MPKRRHSKVSQQYVKWRNSLPKHWRIIYDIAYMVLAIILLFCALMVAIQLIFLALILLLPFLPFGIGGSKGSKKSPNNDDDDPRGNGPRSMAPDYFH